MTVLLFIGGFWWLHHRDLNTSRINPVNQIKFSTRLATPAAVQVKPQVATYDPNTPLPGNLLIADRGNNRVIEVTADKRIVWEYPTPSTPSGERLNGVDDSFLTPNGKAVIVNEEDNQTIKIIDYATRKLLWSYGHSGIAGRAPGYLNTPDDAYQLPDGTVTVADIRNCRVLFINQDKTILKQYGKTGVCKHNPPVTYGSPNGDTPLPDGGVLITEINGSYVDRLDNNGNILFSVHTPLFYPSDAQLTNGGNLVIADYHLPGRVIKMSPSGKVLWSYGPGSGPGKLNYPSLAIELPNGNIALNDDDNDRVIIIDPRINKIVWEYGTTGVASSKPGFLADPDGIGFVPPGTHSN